MVESAVEAEKFEIQHVGQPRQREPVAGERVPEGPADAVQREPGPNVRIGGDVIGIVIVDEAEVQRLPVCHESRNQENGDDGEIGCPPGVRGGGLSLMSGSAHRYPKPRVKAGTAKEWSPIIEVPITKSPKIQGTLAICRLASRVSGRVGRQAASLRKNKKGRPGCWLPLWTEPVCGLEVYAEAELHVTRRVSR